MRLDEPKSLWVRLVAPHPSIVDPHRRRVLALAASWNFFTIPLGPILGLLQLLAGEGDRVSLVWVLAAPVSTIVNYALTRSRFGWPGLWLQVMSILGLVGSAMLVSPDRAATAMALVLPVLVSALCFRLREVILVQVAALMMLISYAIALPAEQKGHLIGTGVVLVAAFAVLAAIVRQRELMVENQLRGAEAEILRARALLDASFDGTADIVDGRLVRVSEGFSRALGYSRSSLEGREIDQTLAVLNSERTRGDEVLPFLDGEGSLRYLSVLRQELPGGSETSEVLAVRDQSHEQLYKSNLMFAHRMASVGTLAAGVAHEINNALTSLTGHSELGPRALENDDKAGAGRSFHAIQSAAERIGACVKQLQRFGSDIESADETVDINDIVSSTLQLAHHHLRTIGELQVELKPQICRGQGSESFVGQVLMNLIINAIDVLGDTKDGQLRIETFEDASWVGIIVGDNGPGIPELERERIFQPFFTTKGERGTGLGLSISSSLALRMGGSLQLEPSEEGAVFCLRIPRLDLSEDGPEEVASPGAFDSQKKVLLVDDETEVLEVLAELLQPMSVTTAGSVAEARASWREDFDIIISDIVMPGETGLDLRQWLAQNHPHALSRLVLMTGSAVGIEAEFDALDPSQMVLQKPVRGVDLAQLIRKLQDKRAES